MPFQTPADITAGINAAIIDNSTRLITEPVMRNLLNDIAEYFTRPTVTHSGDGPFQGLVQHRLVVLDTITANRVYSFPVTPYAGQRVELFVVMTTGFNWTTNLNFNDGVLPRNTLSTGEQRFIWDNGATQWLLIGGE